MKNSGFLFIGLLIIVGFAIYAPNLNNVLFWDDNEWIVSNPFVYDFSHLKEIFTENILAGYGLNSNYYRPLLLLSFAVNYVIDGVKPLGYHLVSNGFHIANGLLIFFILTGVFKRRLPAFLAALLFLIHPLQTEAVTYISGRGDPMSVFFMLLALYLWTNDVEHRYDKTVDNSRQRHAVSFKTLSVISMVLAILSRETAILFPLLLMVFYISFLSAEKFWKSIRQAFIEAIPYFAVSVAYGILRLTVLNFKNTLNFYSQANDYTAHLSYRLYTFGHALVEYFKLIFVPLGLHMERELSINTSLFQWPVWLGALIVLCIMYYVLRFYKNEKWENDKLMANGKWQMATPFRVWLFGWGWFFIGLGPVSGIIPINAVMYEHWLYLPLIGLAVLAGFYISKLLGVLSGRRFLRGALVVLLIVYFSFFALASAKRNLAWGNPVAFYEEILRYSPDSIRITNNLGNLYSEEGRLDDAAKMYQKIIDNPGNLFAQPYYNLGNIYRDQKNIEAAIGLYKKAIEVDPAFSFAYQNLSVIYANRGQLVDAAEMLEKVKELRPAEPRVYYNLALIYTAQNKFSLAIANLEQGLKFSGNDQETEAAIKFLLSKLQN